MKGKFVQLSLGLVVLAALAVGAAGCGSNDISAFSVNGHDVTQRSVDAELKALRDNAPFRTLADKDAANGNGPAVSTNPYSVTTALSSTWVTQLIQDQLIKRALAEQHGKVTAAERAQALQQTTQNFGGAAVFSHFPKSFRDAAVDRTARLFGLATALNADLTTQAGATTIVNELSRVGRRTPVSVDPRYGTWNARQLVVQPPLAPGERRPTTVNPATGG